MLGMALRATNRTTTCCATDTLTCAALQRRACRRAACDASRGSRLRRLGCTWPMFTKGIGRPSSMARLGAKSVCDQAVSACHLVAFDVLTPQGSDGTCTAVVMMWGWQAKTGSCVLCDDGVMLQLAQLWRCALHCAVGTGEADQMPEQHASRQQRAALPSCRVAFQDRLQWLLACCCDEGSKARPA